MSDEFAELLKAERETRRLVAQFAADFLAASARGLDGALQLALRSSAEQAGADRSAVYLLSTDGQLASLAFDWSRPGVPSLREQLPSLLTADTRWWWSTLEREGSIVVADVDAMPSGAGSEQVLFRDLRMLSLIAFPLRREGRTLGFIIFDALRARRTWSVQAVEFLGTVSDLLAIALGLRASQAAREGVSTRFDKAERLAGIGHWELNLVTGELAWSAELHRLFETDRSSFKPSYEHFLELIHPEDRGAVNRAYQRSLMAREPYQLVHRLLMKDGRVKHVEERCETEYSADGRALLSRGTVQDVSGRVAHEEALERVAYSDRLTGLPNRAGMARSLQQAMDVARNRGRRLALCVLDIDDFKDVNDARGQAVGDALLKQVGQRLSLLIPGDGHIARLGGDEYAVLITGVGEAADCVPLVMRALAVLSEPINHDGLAVRLTASIGVTLYPQERDLDADQLLRQAQQALYQAKLLGKNRYHLYDVQQEDAALSQSANLREVRQAIARRGFELFYQPKVNMRTGEVVGAEALVRWHHPDRGLLSPGEFLPWIKDHPLDVELGERILEDALRQLRAWRAEGRQFPVSVNVSAQQLLHPRFFDRLQALLERYPTPPGMLELEILESSAMQDMQSASEVMRRSRALGVSFALDDFGTGYSSLAYLRKLPASTLKIDQAFVNGMRASAEDLAIINAVVGMGRAFDMRVVAEGVDTIAIGELLLRLGCEVAQGYAILPPAPAERLETWISQWRTPEPWTRITPASEADLKILLAGVEHSRWMQSLRAFLKDESPPPPMDPTGCVFGSWLHGEGESAFGNGASFLRVCEHHRAIHDLGRELEGLRDDGRRAEAMARLHELDELSERMLEELVRLTRNA